MAMLQNAVFPNSLELKLNTLTPLYTGGVAMNGEQVHPSGLLGGIRRFSSLVAHALGDQGFDHRVWGQVDGPQEQHHAKRIGLHFDFGGLNPVSLPSPITLPTPGPHRHHGWFFGQAQTGTLGLRITPLGCNLTKADWNLIALALRIQIQHATFGAKDQFGLGVLDTAPESVPSAQRLQSVATPPPIGPGLHQAFFAKLSFPCQAPTDMEAKLLAGLAWRRNLRDYLRGWPRTAPREMDQLRHYTLGYLGGGQSYGSAVNISAVYPLPDNTSGIRIWGFLPHTQPKPSLLSSSKIFRIFSVLRDSLDPGGHGPADPIPCAGWTLDWHEWDPRVHPHISDWLNLIAGVE